MGSNDDKTRRYDQQYRLIGQRLREMRTKSERTQVDVAFEVLDQHDGSRISKLENGDGKMTLDELFGFSEYFGVRPEEFLRDIDLG